MRIFDNPNHPQYGPVRRMWIVLVQLDLLDTAEKWGKNGILDWDEWLAVTLADNPHVNESVFQRNLFTYVMQGV